MKHLVQVLMVVWMLAAAAWAQTTYYSVAGATQFNTLSNWGTNTDGSGSNPSSISNADDYIVANGANITSLGANISVRNLTINTGASLTVPSTPTLTCSGTGGGTLTVNGTLTLTGSAASQINVTTLTIASGGSFTNQSTSTSTSRVTATNFNVNNGGTYIHDAVGSSTTGATADFPGSTRTIAASSNVSVLQWGGTGSPQPLPNVIYGNLTLNISTSWGGSMNMSLTAGNTFTVAGNFTISSTGGGVRQFRISNQNNTTLAVGGNFTINGGQFNMTNAGGPVSQTINVGGNLSFTGGTWDYTTGASNALTINFTGGASNVTFNTSGGTFNSTTLNRINWVVASGKTVTMNSGFFLGAGANAGLTVTGTLDAQSNQISASGGSTPITINGTLRTSNNAGFTGSVFGTISSTNSPTVTLGGASTIEYYSSGSQTVTARTDYNNVTISGGTQSLGFNATVGGTLALNTGTLSIGANTLTLNGGITTTSGTLTGGATSNVTIGGSGATALSLPAISGGLNNLTLNHTRTASVALAAPLSMVGALTLTNGILQTDATNSLTLGTAATVSGGSATSYVNGPAVLNTNSTTPRTVPVGKGIRYRNVTLTPQSGTATTWNIEYFGGDPTAAYTGDFSAAGFTDLSRFEYWIINRTSGTDNAQVTLNWDALSQINAAQGNIRVARYTGSVWNSEGGTATCTGGDCLNGGTITSNVVTSFSPFALGTTSGVLPVRWLSFTAQRVAAAVQLDWATANELNNRGFGIERSTSATFENAQTIGFVSGAGTTNAQQRYTYVDAAAPAGTAYYRLKQQDYDGAFEYSTIVAVGAGNDQPTFSISPNPSTGEVRLTGTNVADGAVEVLLYNSLGTQLLGTHSFVADAMLQLNAQLATVAPGLYTVVIRKGNHSQNLRLVRQ